MSARRAAVVCVVLSTLLGAWSQREALDAGFWSDDYLQQAMLEGTYPVARARADLFRFDDGSVSDRRALVDYGYYPWWTHERFELAMLRPLPSLLHALDHALFPESAFAQHVHSLLWWGLSVAAVGALLFAVLPPAAAAIAVVFYALDETHSIPLVWLSNRSPLIATSFGALALFAHVRHRRTGAAHARALAIAAAAAALASGEYAFSMLAYLLSFELVAREPLRARVRALLPFALLAVSFVMAWTAAGYGAAHSGLYTNPLRTPGAYLEKVVTGVPLLLGELALGVRADLTLARSIPHVYAWQLGLSLAGALWAAWLLRRTRRRLSAAHADALLGLCLGALLGLLPVLGSFVTTRLALCSSIGAAALFGCVVADAFGSLRARAPRAMGSLALAGLVLAIHGLGAAIASYAATSLYAHIARARTRAALAAALDDATIARQRIVMVAAADPNDAPYLPFVRSAHGHPLARGFRLLSGSSGAHELTRVDSRTLDVRVLDAPAPGQVVGSLTRASTDRLTPGRLLGVAGMTVQVLALAQDQPVVTRFTFAVPLEDPSLVWLQQTERGLERLVPPAVGTSLRLPPPVSPDVVYP